MEKHSNRLLFHSEVVDVQSEHSSQGDLRSKWSPHALKWLNIYRSTAWRQKGLRLIRLRGMKRTQLSVRIRSDCDYPPIVPTTIVAFVILKSSSRDMKHHSRPQQAEEFFNEIPMQRLPPGFRLLRLFLAFRLRCAILWHEWLNGWSANLANNSHHSQADFIDSKTAERLQLFGGVCEIHVTNWSGKFGEPTRLSHRMLRSRKINLITLWLRFGTNPFALCLLPLVSWILMRESMEENWLI